jgi:tetratricopeptide (TPR) repeat protein/transcriptional regulator with XRE-family HTH domain
MGAVEPFPVTSFAGILRHYRLKAGLTQEELAEDARVSARTISDLERGRAMRPYPQTIGALAAALGLRGPELDDFVKLARQRRAPPALRAAADPALPAGRPGASAVPQQLPAAVASFTGRDNELAQLTSLLEARDGTAAAALVISAISGTAGVGKTALAVHWAHTVAGRFPDGQLYVNLRGYDPAQPVAPGEALAGFLTALGVPGPLIPADEADRAAAFRSALAGRRVLIMLDNASEPGQVRPLLPGEPGCLVVVTSRDMLPGLVARNGARRVVLDVLPPDDAVALLRTLVGARVDADPAAAASLARLCCYLPLMLRLAAEQAAARPGQPLAVLADELDGQGRLDALEAGGDDATAIRAVFSWSCRNLSPAAARTFRLAGLHPGADFGIDAVAALTATSEQAAVQALTELTRASLVHQTGAARYGMHDLLRAYATELAASQDTESDRREALSRLLDHYLLATQRAASVLFPADVAAPAEAADLGTGGVFRDEPEAVAWLNSERANLISVAVFAAERGRPAIAAGLSAALFRYLDTGSFFSDALLIHGAAASGAIRAGDRAAEAAAVSHLGFVHLHLGRLHLAEQHFRRALAVSREVGDTPGEIRALGNLSQTYLNLDAYADARVACQQARELSRSAGDRAREARTLHILGKIAIRQGFYRQASTDLIRAAEASREVGDLPFLTLTLLRLGEAEVRQGHYHEAMPYLQEARSTMRKAGYATAGADLAAVLGLAEMREGRHQEAAQHLKQALSVFHDAGMSASEPQVISYLGELHLRQGNPAGAADCYQQALALCHRAGQPSAEAEAHNGVGEAALAQNAPEEASEHHQKALAIARKIANPPQEGRAHEGLGDVCAAVTDSAGALHHWDQALALYAQMGVPEAERVRLKMAVAETSLASGEQRP